MSPTRTLSGEKKTLIETLSHSLSIVNVDIDTEEKCARASDVADPNYPMLARLLRGRPDNLKVAIAALSQRLDASEPVSEERIAT
jgi:hypothetical protein